MWYEILPSAAIIYTALTIPGLAMYALHKLVLGNAYRRDLRLLNNRYMYLRDRRLTNNPYLLNDLDIIPDEDS